ncbi:DNA-directed RNA polymerase, mitochondrial isoform X2 [Ahaetulla prasina]|uniref:DNA-directed RNA polymerase, mitochondrial isoform X2 n=1 Tax=Ahaetulla prasina TaxID=499056 RepID=UPI002649DA3D|nr:DNA-directed RNA polymerase, mitochondrial isoform X2 [Ahaetulla prasina]
MLKLQGTLRWGKGSLRVGVRCYSTRVKEESRKLWLHEQVELLEVLEARVKQLRADNESDILKPKIQVCQIKKFNYFPGAHLQKTAVPQTPQGKPVVPTDEAAHLLKVKTWKAKVKMEKQASKMKRWDLNTRTLESILSSKTLVEKAVKCSPKSATQPTADGSEAQSDCKMSLMGIPVWDKNQPPDSSALRASVEPMPMLNGRLLPEMKIFQDDIRMTILAYMDTSLFKGQKRKALQCLLYFHHTPGLKKFLTTQMFSLLMCHYAKQGALKKIGWLFSMLEENNLKPNQDCYMAVLNCMGRINTKPHIISRCIEQLESEGFSLQSFFKDSTYEDNEVMMILRAIQTVKPDFQPEFFSPPTSTIPLLEIFYKKKKSVSYTKLNFTAEELQQRFRKQYSSEASDKVTVESVEATKPITATTIKAREILSKIRSEWEATLLHNLSKLKKQENIWHTSKLDVYPFLCVLTEKEYVELMMQTVFSLPALGECVSILAKDLGTRIYNKYTILRKSCTISEDSFEKTYDSYVKLLARDTQIGFIKPHSILIRILQEASETTLTFDSFILPMQCPPVPWVSSHFGAYTLSPVKLMRCQDGVVQHELLLDECPHDHLCLVLDALNFLGNCPWKVNQPVLDVIISIFNDKGDEKLDIPPPPSWEAKELAKQLAESAPMSRMALKWKMAQCRKKTRETYSLRMDMLYKLSIAKHMKDEVFWFPHNLDFRGRTYPCPPHFNHLGGDFTRGILLFAEGKPLGPRGLDWLKIHLVNLTGLKKKNSLKERLTYANHIMPDILDSADNPLMGKRWWMDTDEPWQVLACSMEIANAVRSPKPSEYISHFPVHQDGSCNGLQHYAALGRDVLGAYSVNLAPSGRPQDVYTSVSQEVEKSRQKDAEKGLRIAQVLDGYVTRKVVKQTVMTVVYGVTQYGGRLQIEKQLKEIEDFPKEDVWQASKYLVRLVFECLSEMFSGSREIQNWLTESAWLISKSGQTVEWVTPLGLPIIQPYHNKKSILVKGDLQSLHLKSNYNVGQKPNTRKQKNAFPPNFIHSLDSSHMMLTALHCQKAGLTFVSVHDCFWTHAATVDIMNKICREQFVTLHSQPILEDLSKFMLQKYCSNPTIPESEIKKKKAAQAWIQDLKDLLPKIPKKGDFKLEKVKKSIYFFN